MIGAKEFLLHAGLDAAALEAWIEAGWLVPQLDSSSRRFSDIDLARAQLIRDLKDDFGINDEGVSVILDLVDQVHGLRRILREIVLSIHAQPEAMRRRIADELQTSLSDDQSLGADHKHAHH